MIYPNPAVCKVQIAHSQTAKLADTHPGSKQNNKFIIILGIGLVLLDKGHPDVLLFLGHSNTLLRIIGNDIYQLEVKEIPADNILVAGHLEGRLYNTANAGDRAVPFPILVELYDPLLGIRNFDVPDLMVAEVLFFDQIEYKIIPDPGYTGRPVSIRYSVPAAQSL